MLFFSEAALKRLIVSHEICFSSIEQCLSTNESSEKCSLSDIHYFLHMHDYLSDISRLFHHSGMINYLDNIVDMLTQ